MAELSLTIPDRRARVASRRGGTRGSGEAGQAASACGEKKQESRLAGSGRPRVPEAGGSGPGGYNQDHWVSHAFSFSRAAAGRMAGVASDILSAVTLRASLPLPAFGLRVARNDGWRSAGPARSARLLAATAQCDALRLRRIEYTDFCHVSNVFKDFSATFQTPLHIFFKFQGF